MQRTRYLVAYDIREDHRLRQVHSIAMDFGYPLQYSVFICDLDEREKFAMRIALGNAIDHRVDSVVFVDLGEPGSRGIDCFEFMGEGSRDDLPHGGPVIL
ncbi:MAG: CRISPR-associated endonuclease Cas2 [Nitriliruptorales bacterium]